MSAPVLPVSSDSTQNGVPETKRCSANYQPSIWGDYFISYHADDNHFQKSEDGIDQQVQILKEEVKRLLVTPFNNPSEKLDFIDAVQRLGVSYHFEAEIDEILQQMYNNYKDCENGGDIYGCDFHSTALWFRLLRQQGYNISCDVFNKFKDSKGNFKESVLSNVKEMLSLYEAAHMRVHGEDILDEALAFTTTNLEAMAPHLSPSLAAQVRRALNQPIRTGLRRLEARHFMSVYEQDPSHDKVLLAFAKLDFNLLQKIHQKELSKISRWWKDLDFSRKLHFARDRVVELYFWILGVYFEPHHALARVLSTKVIAMTSVLDDIYDNYGTYEELQLLTNAIERWDISAMDQLPEYMKLYYQALLDVYTEIEEKISDKKSYRLYHAKEVMKNQARAYFQEAKWLHQQYTPTLDEYMRVALVTSGYKLLVTTSFVGMGDVVTKDVFEWLSSIPKMVKASEIISRLMDDIASHKFEQKRGHVVSAVQCYMKEHGTTEEEAEKEFRTQVENAWKDINEECLSPTEVPMVLLKNALNLSRTMHLIYKDDQDGYTNAGIVLKDIVTSVLVNSVPV